MMAEFCAGLLTLSLTSEFDNSEAKKQPRVNAITHYFTFTILPSLRVPPFRAESQKLVSFLSDSFFLLTGSETCPKSFEQDFFSKRIDHINTNRRFGEKSRPFNLR